MIKNSRGKISFTPGSAYSNDAKEATKVLGTRIIPCPHCGGSRFLINGPYLDYLCGTMYFVVLDVICTRCNHNEKFITEASKTVSTSINLITELQLKKAIDQYNYSVIKHLFQTSFEKAFKN